MTEPTPNPSPLPGMPEVGQLMPADAVMVGAVGVTGAAVMHESGVTDCVVLTAVGHVAADMSPVTLNLVLPPGGALQLAGSIAAAVDRLPGGAR